MIPFSFERAAHISGRSRSPCFQTSSSRSVMPTPVPQVRPAVVRATPGNCTGELIKDLLNSSRPNDLLAPMTGRGTWADACRHLGIDCVSFDIRQGTDACDPESYRGSGTFDFVWLNPPYWR